MASKRATCSLTNPKAQALQSASGSRSWAPRALREGRLLRPSAPGGCRSAALLAVSVQPRVCSLLFLFLVNSVPLPLSWAHLWCRGGSTWIVQDKPRISNPSFHCIYEDISERKKYDNAHLSQDENADTLGKAFFTAHLTLSLPFFPGITPHTNCW